MALEVYKLTADFPKEEQYGLISQMRRASVSIPSNIAEGHARKSQRELQRYLNMAKGSLAELETQLVIAQELGFGDASRYSQITALSEQESRMISGLIRSVSDTL